MMKQIMFLILFTSSLTNAQSNLGAIANAISGGDATTLATYFDQDIEMTILDDLNLYSKAEAKQKVAAFFTKNKPTKYTQVHQGKSQGAGGQYCVGIMETAKQKYRVELYLEKVTDNFLIKEIKFEKE